MKRKYKTIIKNGNRERKLKTEIWKARKERAKLK
tara:strand:+ start:309 stop:410 length:102 start_codon:yes stop_codon:yes gene_type:complete